MSEEQATQGKKPTHTAYSVREFTAKESGEVRSDWSKVGAAWEHNDGKGFNLRLESVPLSGNIVLRVNEPKKD